MEKRLKDTPDNFSEIKDYVITDPKEISYQIIQAPKCYFYDTCSFRKHMLISNLEPLFEYIKRTEGIVIITRCVLMELCSSNNQLWTEQVRYIQKMKEVGIEVLVMFEEDIFETMTMCFSNSMTANKLLAFAIRNAKSKTGTVSKVLNEHIALKKEILSGIDNKDSSLYRRFFQLVRKNKESEDNLGEELFAICMHLLSNIPEFMEYKYVLLTEGKGAITLLGKTIRNVKEYIGKSCITAFTTTKLIQLMQMKNINLTDKEIIEFLCAGNTGTQVKLMCSEEYELEPIEKTMEIEELAKKLIRKETIWIYL